MLEVLHLPVSLAFRLQMHSVEKPIPLLVRGESHACHKVCQFESSSNAACLQMDHLPVLIRHLIAI